MRGAVLLVLLLANCGASVEVSPPPPPSRGEPPRTRERGPPGPRPSAPGAEGSRPPAQRTQSSRPPAPSDPEAWASASRLKRTLRHLRALCERLSKTSAGLERDFGRLLRRPRDDALAVRVERAAAAGVQPVVAALDQVTGSRSTLALDLARTAPRGSGGSAAEWLGLCRDLAAVLGSIPDERDYLLELTRLDQRALRVLVVVRGGLRPNRVDPVASRLALLYRWVDGFSSVHERLRQDLHPVIEVLEAVLTPDGRSLLERLLPSGQRPTVLLEDPRGPSPPPRDLRDLRRRLAGGSVELQEHLRDLPREE